MPTAATKVTGLPAHRAVACERRVKRERSVRGSEDDMGVSPDPVMGQRG
jgi:hypothetical protein